MLKLQSRFTDNSLYIKQRQFKFTNAMLKILAVLLTLEMRFEETREICGIWLLPVYTIHNIVHFPLQKIAITAALHLFQKQSETHAEQHFLKFNTRHTILQSPNFGY